MAAQHGCTDNKVVIESFREALIGRVGADRYRMWFSHGVTIELSHAPEASTDDAASSSSQKAIVLSVRGQFALDRLKQNFLREMRGAAMQACGGRMEVQLKLAEPTATQASLPLHEDEVTAESTSSATQESDLETTEAASRIGVRRATNRATSDQRDRVQRTATTKPKRRAVPLAKLIAESNASSKQTDETTAPGTTPVVKPQQLEFSLRKQDGTHRQRHSSSQPSASVSSASASKESTNSSAFAMNAANFVAGTSNQLAYTAMTMVVQDPKTASPIFFCGPTGTGKTHLMSAIAEQFRRRYRMRRVMHLSAEQFTNDFISSVGNSGITAFRRRYREVDALLIDDVQFLGSKKATLREMLYTVETLAGAGRPLLFSGMHAPTEIQGLSRELAGRMASGLVCPMQPLDLTTRRAILQRWLNERCQLEVPGSLIDQINTMLAGDGRVISGVVNMVNTLQRMYGRMPLLDEIRQFGGDLLRVAAPVATLTVIETAVCDAFHLPHDTLRGGSQTRAVTGPRMLAMYLSRQLTSSAYSEIAKHFGGKSHSTAISAENNVKKWLDAGKAIGRGQAAMSVREAIDRVENLLRSG